ncbi:MAG: CBS domain-containing protein [Nitrospinota bacterium]
MVTVGKETPVHEAVKKMLENKIGCLPVVTEEMELIGMVTETDILRCFVEYLDEGA